MANNNLNIEELLSITRKAGNKIMQIYDGNQNNWEVTAKSDDSPLTIADKASNDIICEGLKALYPEIPIISEENKEISYSKRREFDSFWLVDPLDGTKEFIKRNGEFTVNIALISDKYPVFGVVYAPVLKKMYWAEKNNGAFKVNENGDMVKINCNTYSLQDNNLRIVSSRSHINEETMTFIKQFQEYQNVSMGSSLKFMLIAEGKADIYPRLGPTMEWDTAASQIICEEAGGKVVNFKTNEIFEYNKESLLNGYFIVYGNVID